MKSCFSPILVTSLLLLLSDLVGAQGQHIKYSGGDGSSFEKAVVINGATEKTGVHAEYDYIEKHFPGYHRGLQRLLDHNGHAFDVLDFTTKEGKSKTIYFDISAFFGKNQ